MGTNYGHDKTMIVGVELSNEGCESTPISDVAAVTVDDVITVM